MGRSVLAVRPRRWLRGVLLLLVLALQAGWLAAWSFAFGGWVDGDVSGPVLGVPTLVGLLGLATLVSRVATTRLKASRVARLAVAVLGLGLASLVGAVVLWTASGAAGWAEAWAQLRHTSLGLRGGSAVALALLAWWRGIATGQNRLSLDEAETAFRGATFALTGVFLVDILTGLPPAVSDASVVAAGVVLFAGLIAMPLARIVDLSERSPHGDAASLGLRVHWVAILLGTVSALLLVTYALARVFTFQRIEELTRPLAGPADALLWDIIYVIAVPLGFLIEGIIYLLRLILHPRALTEPSQALSTDWLATLRAQAQGGSGPPVLLIFVLRGIAISVLVILVLWLLVRAIFRFAEWGSEDAVEETREFIFSWSELREGFRQMLRKLLKGRQLRLGPSLAHRAQPARGNRHLWGPRELYRELLRMGAQHGRARTPDETPLEYQQVLTRIAPFDVARGEIQLLTSVYAQARYGEEAPAEVVVAKAREALDYLCALDDDGAAGSEIPPRSNHLDAR